MTGKIGCIAALLTAGLLAGAAAPALAQDHAALMKEHRGGTMRLVARAAEGTIDPHINYTLKNWQFYQFTYDGLVTFRKATGKEGFQVVADLAEAIPTPTNDGKTWTFKLRKGIQFSDGSDLDVEDVVASLQRIFKVSSPTSGSFYNVIVGADACLAKADTCTLEGGVIGDAAAGTVTINLTRPDAEFLFKLALPHAVILPSTSPMKDVGTTPLPGTGAYMISSYDPNTRLEMVRNPHFKEWSVEAQPDGFPDEIDYDFGLTEEAQVSAIINGQADWMYDPPPTDRLAELGKKYRDQVHVTPLTAMWYAPMNTRLAPFDNIKARQAVAYAIDRRALVNLFGGPVLAQPVCQVLPPGFPGHQPYCPFTQQPGAKWSAPDVEKAKQLVQESGTAGQEVTIIVQDQTTDRNIGVYLQSVLNDLGYKASVKAISTNIQFTYIQNTNNKVQMSVSQWYQDYPAASDFLNVLFGCGSFREGSDSSINISGYCDEAVQKQMDEAMALGVTDPEAANKQWAAIDKAVTDAAPAAFLFTPKHLDFVSSRLGNFQFNSQYYWMMAQSWVQ
ncbi:MAG: ABC transporter substrate-binding protein [Geminicoccaceae bacterium]